MQPSQTLSGKKRIYTPRHRISSVTPITMPSANEISRTVRFASPTAGKKRFQKGKSNGIASSGYSSARERAGSGVGERNRSNTPSHPPNTHQGSARHQTLQYTTNPASQPHGIPHTAPKP